MAPGAIRCYSSVATTTRFSVRRLLIIAIITIAAIPLEGDYWRPFLAIAAAVIGLIEVQAVLDRRRVRRMRERTSRAE
ncbi:hypothetical protein NOVOSPHI9U_370020 [Novosphingobium sp. 9U]|nr:hypothetical protein NOVOSPHI9U_370020 [Novosphingobium sp. 9U]